MATRPRVYMLIVAAVRLALACLLLTRSTNYNAPYFQGEWAHEAWAVFLIGVGVLALVAAITGNVLIAQLALLLAVITSGFWSGQMVADGWAFGVVFLLGIALKDGTMLRNPLRDPFDKLVARKTVATTGK